MTDNLQKYAKAVGREEWANRLSQLVPDRMIGGIVRYIVDGVPPGHFLRAVFANDLMEAIKRADEENALLLKQYFIFLYNYAPSGCFGSRKKYADWIKGGGLNGVDDNG